MIYIKKHLRDGLKVLGDGYSLQTIDFEVCLYKDLGNGIDLEISHGESYYLVFVWLNKRRVIETSGEISLSELKETLANIEEKYKNYSKEQSQ